MYGLLRFFCKLVFGHSPAGLCIFPSNHRQKDREPSIGRFSVFFVWAVPPGLEPGSVQATRGRGQGADYPEWLGLKTVGTL